MNDPETVLLIDSWESQEAIDIHHASPMMQTIASLREKYDLHMKVERFISDEDYSEDKDSSFIRNCSHLLQTGEYTCRSRIT